MKTLLITTALIISATSASAYTCKNTVTSDASGVITYTSSQCGNQAPASADMLTMITYIANNPPKDNVVDDVVVEVPLTKLEKLTLRERKLYAKNMAKMDTLRKIATRFGVSDPDKFAKKLNNAIIKLVDPATTGNGKNEFRDAQALLDNATKTLTPKAQQKIDTIKDKMENIRVDKNKVEARIAKLSDTPK